MKVIEKNINLDDNLILPKNVRLLLIIILILLVSILLLVFSNVMFFFFGGLEINLTNSTASYVLH